MTDDEKLKFCGQLTMAARNLGIYGRIQEDYFVWFDPMANNRWKTPPADNKKDILVNACKSLTEYLWNPQAQNT